MDGSIRINTELNNAPLQRDANETEEILTRTGEKITTESQATADRVVEEFQKSADGIKRCFEDVQIAPGDSIKDLIKYLDKMNDRLQKTQAELDKATQEYEKFKAETNEALQGATKEQVDNYMSMYGKQLVEARQRQQVLNDEVNEYKADIQAATDEVKRLTEAQAEEARVSAETKLGGRDLTNAVSGQDFLGKIQSEQQYQQVLSETQSRMAMIEAEAQKIATTRQIPQEELLNANSEYQKLAQRQQLLIANQERFKGKVAETTAETKNMGKAATNASAKARVGLNSARKSANNFGDSIQKGIKKLGKMALAVFGIRAAYMAVRKATNAYMEDNQELQNQMTAMWSVIGQAIGPIIEWMMKGVTIAITYINSLIKALTGVDFIARANAAALKKQASATSAAGAAAQKASKQLASFDEMNKLSDTSSSASGGGGAADSAITFKTDADTSGLQKALDKVKDMFKALFAKIQEDYAPSISAWGTAFENLKQPMIDCITNCGESLSSLQNESLEPFRAYLIDDWLPGVVNSFSETFAPIFQDSMIFSLKAFEMEFEYMCNLIGKLVKDVVKPAFELILSVWQGIMSGIDKAWKTYGQNILNGLLTMKQGFIDTFGYIYDEILKPIIDWIFVNLKSLWDEHLQPLWDNICDFFGSITELVLAVWNNALKPLVDRIIVTFAPYIVNAVQIIISIVKTLFGYVSDVVSGIIKALNGLMNFLTGVFTGDWKKALNGIIKILNAALSAMFGGVKGVVNLLIDGLNLVWSAIYSVVASIVNTVGKLIDQIGSLIGKDWHFSMPNSAPKISKMSASAPQIPYLAKGGIVNNPGRGVAAIIGESGKEAVLPLDKNTEWMDILADKIGGNVTIPVILDGKQIAKYVINLNNKRTFALNGGY